MCAAWHATLASRIHTYSCLAVWASVLPSQLHANNSQLINLLCVLTMYLLMAVVVVVARMPLIWHNVAGNFELTQLILWLLYYFLGAFYLKDGKGEL